MNSPRPTVVVVGAGISGLAAAHSLIRDGFHVTVIEARPRIGGRIDTRYDFAAVPIELGAEFVHGRHPRLVELIRDAGLHLEERRFDPLILEGGRSSQPQSWQKVFQELADPEAPDVPIGMRIGEMLKSGQWSEVEARRLRRYVEGYMAADVDRVSARALSEETRAGLALGDDGNASIREGYDALVRHLGRRLVQPSAELRLDTAVRRIAWQKGSADIEVDRPDGGRVRAGRVIITVPLSLLQAASPHPPVEGWDSVVFEPAIPPIGNAARRLAMGNVVKLYLRFRCPLAEIPGVAAELGSTLVRTRVLQTPSGRIPTWWRVGDDAGPILVGWAGGASADKLAGKAPHEIVAAGIDSLADALAIPCENVASAIEATAVADWSADRWARGAYSWIPAGALDAPLTLATPVENTLFFAGEATDTSGYRGTVHGALDTGLRAARQVVESC